MSGHGRPRMLTFIFQIEQNRHFSSFDSELPLGEGLQSAVLLGRLEAGLVSGQSLADGSGLLGAEVQGDVLLALVKLPQVLLLLLVHHNVDPGDRLSDDSDLGELGGGAAGHLGHPKGAQLGLEVLELLDQLLLLLLAQL